MNISFLGLCIEKTQLCVKRFYSYENKLFRCHVTWSNGLHLEIWNTSLLFICFESQHCAHKSNCWDLGTPQHHHKVCWAISSSFTTLFRQWSVSMSRFTNNSIQHTNCTQYIIHSNLYIVVFLQIVRNQHTFAFLIGHDTILANVNQPATL